MHVHYTLEECVDLWESNQGSYAICAPQCNVEMYKGLLMPPSSFVMYGTTVWFGSVWAFIGLMVPGLNGLRLSLDYFLSNIFLNIFKNNLFILSLILKF